MSRECQYRVSFKLFCLVSYRSRPHAKIALLRCRRGCGGRFNELERALAHRVTLLWHFEGDMASQWLRRMGGKAGNLERNRAVCRSSFGSIGGQSGKSWRVQGSNASSRLSRVSLQLEATSTLGELVPESDRVYYAYSMPAFIITRFPTARPTSPNRALHLAAAMCSAGEILRPSLKLNSYPMSYM